MKRPRVAFEPSAKKTPRAATDPGFYQSYPSWRIRMLEFRDPFGWHQVDRPLLDRIRERLKSFESMTWAQILAEGGMRNHLVKKSDLCGEARERLVTLKQDDIDELLSLGLTAKERMWGILENGVVRLLWWDPYHEVCPSHKKHT